MKSLYRDIMALFLCFSAVWGQGTWTSQTSGVTGVLYEVKFIDTLRGWIAGQDGLILATTDGGVQWTKQTTSVTNWLTAVTFLDPFIGWAGGDAGTLLKTTNGGATWSAATSPSSSTIYSIFFTNPATGWLVNYWGNIYKTTNGGVSWQSQISGTSNYLKSIFFTSSTQGYAVGSEALLVTTNGGTTWTANAAGVGNSFSSVYFPTPTVGYAVGDVILKTTDAGVTWTTQTKPISDGLNSVCFVDEQRGWIAANAAKILVTTNGGATWTEQTSGLTGTFISDLSFTDAAHGWGVAGNGSIIKYYASTVPIMSADFIASPVNGTAPLNVQFTDQTMGGPGLWKWHFGDGDSSALQNPSHIYTAAGKYSVTLTASNAVGWDTETKLDFITVSASVPGDPYEPNDSLSAARRITGIADTLSATIDPASDIDYYVFMGYRGDTIDIKAVNGAESTLDGMIKLYSSDGTLIDENDDYNYSTAESRVRTALPVDGDFYIRYAHYSNSAMLSGGKAKKNGTAKIQNIVSTTGAYIMTVRRIGAPISDTTVSGSAGQNFFAAGILDGNDSLQRQFGAAGGWQYYKFILPSDGFLDVRTHNNGLSFLDQFELYNADTNAIYTWGGNTDGLYRLNGFLRSGMYYLRFHHNAAVASLDYALITRFVPATLPPDPEPNDMAQQANPLPVNGPEMTGHAGYSGNGPTDVNDYWKFMVSGDGYVTVTVRLDSLDAKGNRINFDLTLFDVDSVSSIAWDISDDDRVLRTSRWLMPGIYFIRINRAAGDAGGYSVCVTQNVPAAHNDVEPNNVAAAALPLQFDQPMEGHLGYFRNQVTDVVDYWKVFVPQDGYLVVTALMDSLDEAGNRINFDLTLFDVDSTSAISWDNSDDDRTLRGSKWLMPGMYFIRVNKAAGEAGTYSLSAHLSPPTAMNDNEPNDTPVQAQFLTLGQTDEGHLGFFRNQFTDNVDYWKVTLLHDGYFTVTVRMDSLDETGNRINFDLNLYDTDSTSALRWDISDEDRTLAASYWMKSGTYFIRVNKGAGDAGTYTILAQSQPAFLLNDPEPNNDPAAASSLVFGTKKEGHLGFFGSNSRDDVDYWNFTAPTSDSIYVHVVSDSTIEIGLDIMDAAGTTSIAWENASGTYSRVGIKPSSATPYLIKVSRRGMEAGSYSIIVKNSWQYDYTIPTAPKNFSVSAQGPGTFGLTWDANTETDVKGYKVYYAVSTAADFLGTGANEGASPITVGPVTTFTVSGLENERLYRFAVTAIDGAGNESPFSLLRFAQSGSSAVWSLQHSGTNKALNSISFVDQMTGWIVGDSGVALKTTDGGTVWKPLNSPLPSTEHFFGVHFVDINYGWAIGGTEGVCKIFRTTDGGATWASYTSPVHSRPIALHFVDRMYGWVVGDNGMALQTTDGGLQWKPSTLGAGKHLSSVRFTDRENGWIAGQFGTLLHTTDGGTTWNQHSTALSYSSVHLFGPLEFVDALNGWITMENGPFLRTTDGGITWNRDSIPTPNYLWGIDFIDADNGIAVGRGGDIFRTIDGGTTWMKEASGVTTGLYSVVYRGKGTAWAVGADGVILKYESALPPHLIPVPAILSIWDVPNDNGRQVYVSWHSGRRAADAGIRSFALWRYDSDSLLWVNVKENIPSLNDTIFTATAPTVYDSTIAGGMRYTLFKVSSHGMEPAQYALSIPDSGYSLDNLIPSMPDSLTGSAMNGLLVLQWKSPGDDDLRYFAVYRDTVANFLVQESKPYALTTEQTWTDSAVVKGRKYFYRIASVDWSGNRSRLTPEIALTVTTVTENLEPPVSFALEQNYPNPFNPSTTIRFGIPALSTVTIRIYNSLGQEVETLENGMKEAGWHSVTWRPKVSSGMYICRMTAVSVRDYRQRFNSTRKLLFIK